MRLIGPLETLEHAEKFSSFLQRENIANEIEKNSEQEKFLIWVHNEDQVDVAKKWHQEFTTNPKNTFFDPPEQLVVTNTDPLLIKKQPPIKRQFATPLTTLLIVLSAFIFLYEEWTTPTPPKEIEKQLFPMAYAPPIMKDLLYDYPKAYEIGDEITKLYTPEEIQSKKTTDPKLQELIKQFQTTPYWKGLYDEFIISSQQKEISLAYHGPWFEKIQQGEWWRAFTPCLLHGNLLHILFNVMWIVILGYQIEKKINAIKTGIFILLSGIFSNTCEYFISGPNFLGLSGIVCAMAGFIWMRRKKAPWEGYLLHSSTFLFLAIYVLGMFSLELVSFFLQLFGKSSISPGIANTAHITGGLFGMFLGSFKFFAKHIPHRNHQL
ncbi:MAG: rhomboid family intramembrane serine protease [Chlamydiales bacterium]|nr:rhomboid family intramembrane serine protease [Chlamydiales bacterium]